MNKESLETIEKEVSVFVRRIVISEKRNSRLERSAYILLRQLSTHGPAGVKTLAEQLHLDISTISRQAAALENKQYVDKVPNPHDGRAYFYRITELGNRELYEAKQRRYDRLANLLKDWSEEERESFGRLLEKYNRTVSEEKL
ncbi:MarR family winged helix-turn-helix transcriptional regulator [Virgibacillus oceani]|uniref:HTH-type transcriptional regulator YxaD n=1 Tax=Virgibacillus oceani TaxID=1479511 RepID=A0A917M3A2_9BACI|nr:MarR family transcriptional regulator [Virgibacillus oceani]GGG72314.1 putative HTH-type transcriptional regulator YxaD [Virgibacillus oceani]